MDMSQLRFNPATGNFESLAPPSLPRYGNNSAAPTAAGQSYAAPRRSVNDIIGGIGNPVGVAVGGLLLGVLWGVFCVACGHSFGFF